MKTNSTIAADRRRPARTPGTRHRQPSRKRRSGTTRLTGYPVFVDRIREPVASVWFFGGGAAPADTSQTTQRKPRTRP